MKTLVIHPDDRSTDFLKLIYKNMDYDVINEYTDKEALKEEIKNHDRIIMLGHGTGNGLLNPFQIRKLVPGRSLYLVDDSFGDLLREKETITVWCYSDIYCRKHGLKGFHSGMIISEVQEALMMLGYSPLKASELLENMESFARIIGDCIEDTPENMRDYILQEYDYDDDITKFNRKNIKVL